jgi:FtsH-binding integral membrane protein
MNSTTIALSAVEAEQQRFITKVYGWMCAALIVTGLVGMYTASSQAMINLIFGSRLIFFGLIILELFMVAYLVMAVQKMTATTAMWVFLGYSALNGVTLSSIFLVFTAESLASTFFITAGTFGLMSAYGYFTKKDLTNIGNLSIMALLGLILASLINLFFRSPLLYWVTTYVGILIFVALTAYDTQKIKALNIIGNEGTDEDKKEAIIGALTLYLDFINLFLLLLRLFGRRRD